MTQETLIAVKTIIASTVEPPSKIHSTLYTRYTFLNGARPIGNPYKGPSLYTIHPSIKYTWIHFFYKIGYSDLCIR